MLLLPPEGREHRFYISMDIRSHLSNQETDRKDPEFFLVPSFNVAQGIQRVY
jgi:hypothetical protein